MLFAAILLGLVLVLLTGVPVFAGLTLFATAIVYGAEGNLGGMADLVFGKLDTYLLVAIPLFTLMAHFMIRGKVVDDLFGAAHTLLRHLPGGMGVATVAACTVFAAISGSSVATALTIGSAAIPLMIRCGYSPRFAYGVVGGGGTLGILIPPSTVLVIYGIITETDIGKLFVAGILPGIVAIVCLCLAVVFVTWRDPSAGPPAERFTWRERLLAIRGIWGVALLFALVIGGIYGGVFTATEGAGVGAAGAFLFALLRGTLSPRVLLDILIESTRTTAMLFMILIGAMIFTNFINFTSMPAELRDYVLQFSPTPLMVIVMMMVIYLILGMVMEELAIVLLTIPVFFPIVTGLGFDPVWFGILIVTVVEIGMISPPVGLNLFVINSLLPSVNLGTLYRGIWPFVAADVVRLAILIAFPIIALWLPGLMAR